MQYSCSASTSFPITITPIAIAIAIIAAIIITTTVALLLLPSCCCLRAPYSTV
jgi:hypothetical protein